MTAQIPPQRCPVCGSLGPLNKVHVLPRSQGGDGGPSNIVYLCPRCHADLDRSAFREADVVSALVTLMQTSGRYRTVETSPILKSRHAPSYLRPDILATASDSGRILLVEVNGSLTVSAGRLEEAIAHVKAYEVAGAADDYVLAIPARLTTAQRTVARDAGVIVWDLDRLAREFADSLSSITHPVLRSLLLAVASLGRTGAPRSAEAAFVEELRATPPGRSTWQIYQKLVGRILEHLLCPTLSPPKHELPDASGTNRRDLVFSNYAEAGLWSFLRLRYGADYLVVDAKNYAGPVTKSAALQVLNYLKPHGAGMLGMIVSRHGPDKGCTRTIEERWITEGKLLLVLDDNHLEAMLIAREAALNPDTVIRQYIDDFRLSL